jgi:hypothetical protein
MISHNGVFTPQVILTRRAIPYLAKHLRNQRLPGSLANGLLFAQSVSSQKLQVRIDTPESVSARHTLAIWRFSCGWRNGFIEGVKQRSGLGAIPRAGAFLLTSFSVFDAEHAAALAAVKDETAFHNSDFFVRGYAYGGLCNSQQGYSPLWEGKAIVRFLIGG